jgi:F-type H+-transporting ATPase subunit alpha
VAVDRVQAFETRFHQFMATQHSDITADITNTKILSDETEAKLKGAIDNFKRTFGS